MPRMCLRAGIRMMRTDTWVIQFTDEEQQSWLSNIDALAF